MTQHVRMIVLSMTVALFVSSLLAGPRQAHLWCVPGFDRGTEERRVEDGNFSVKLVSYWDREPQTSDFMREKDRIGQMIKHRSYRFMGTGQTQWLAVEYMVLADDAKPSKNIATWVDAHVRMQGKVQLHAPDGITYEQKSIARVPDADDDFMKKHQADQMSSHVGSVTIDGKWHRFFIVCLNRGKESWKIIKVFPVHPKEGASESEATKVERSDLMTAGLFIGGFKVLGRQKPKEKQMAVSGTHGRDLAGDALIEAVKAGDQIKVGELLTKGADPNYKGVRNMTPLGAFVSLPNMEEKQPVLKLLLEKGADPNMVWGDSGTTPFYYLVQRGIYGKVAKILPAVRLMLERGADPNRKQGLFGLTPFSYAVTRTSSPDMDLVRAIAERGGIVTQKMVDSVRDEEVKTYLRSRLPTIASSKNTKLGDRSVVRLSGKQWASDGKPFEIFPGFFLPNPKGYLRVLPGSSIDKKFEGSDQLASFASEILARYVRSESQDPTDDAIEVRCLKTMKDKHLSRKDFNKVVELMTIASKAVAEQAGKCDNLNVVLLPITKKEDSCFSSSITDFNLSVAGKAVKGVSLVSQGWVLVSGKLLQVVRTKSCPNVADARRISPSAENFLRSWIDLIERPNANAGVNRLLPLKRASDLGRRDNPRENTKQDGRLGVGAGDELGERKLSNAALENRKDGIRNLSVQERARNRRMRAWISIVVALISGGISILSFCIAKRQKKKIRSALTSWRSDPDAATSYVPFRCFGNAIRQYVDFSGNMSRGDYWSFKFESYVIGTIIGLLFHQASIVGWLYGAFMLVPCMAASVRRFHDVGKSGFEYIGLFSIPVCTVFAGIFFAEYNISVLRPLAIILVLLSLTAIVSLVVTLFRRSAVGSEELMSNENGAVTNVCCFCGGKMEDDTCLEVEFEMGESRNDANGTYENVRVFCCRDCRNRAFEEGLDFDAVMQIDQVKQLVSGGAKIKKISG